MTLENDLSSKPYFDDFDPSKNFYQVLYRPAVAVQARELNQMQSILQDQIDKFGRHIFKEGSVVEGCAFAFDNNYYYVKIKDNYANNFAISTLEDFVGKTAINSNGLRAQIVNQQPGFEAQAPDLNTLYLKYLNSTTFANGTQQSEFSNGEVIQVQTESSPFTINITANTAGVSNTADVILVSSANSLFNVGDSLYYGVPTGNTAIPTLSGNTFYFVSFTNSSSLALATTFGGANIDIAETRTGSGETHTLTKNAGVNIGNVVVATVSNSTGKGYAFATGEGVIFKKGYFIRVEPQTIIVSKYNNVPDNISVGFDAIEQLVTPEIDTSLLDNAAGSPNFEAPGAHRLKLVSNLITRETTSIANTTSFFSLCDFKSGLPVSIKNDPQYASLAKENARRTFETNGDYVVNPFLLSTEKKFSYTSPSANADYLSIVSSPGIAYVKGYRVEFINNNTADLRKANNFLTATNQLVTANFGYYFNTDQFVGDFNNDGVAEIEIHNVAKTAITSRTFLSTAYSSTTRIGTAFVRGVEYYEGTPGVDAKYSVYVFDLRIQAGKKIADARSLMLYTGGSLRAVADIVLEKDFLGNDIAKIQESASEPAIFPFGQKAIRPEGFSATAQYAYRNRANADFISGTGSLSLSLATASGTGSETFNYGTGVLNQNGENTFLIIPYATGYSPTRTGTVNVFSTSTNVSGSSTLFTTQYIVGDYIFTNSATRRITSIANNTLMFVDSAYAANATGQAHQKVWPAGVPINFRPSSRQINITSNTEATVSLGETSNANFGTSVYFDVSRSSTVPIGKSVNKSTFVKIQANTNAGGATGPWCLGIPDVFRLNAVYVDNGSNTYLTSNPNRVNSFRLDTGQRDGFYGLAYISSTSPIAPNATLLVSVDNFIANTSQGVGFFTAASYPVTNAVANSSTIQLWEIPRYVSSTGNVFDLRDSVDFRPFANNTANAIANTTTATINPSATLSIYSYNANGSYLPSPGTNYSSTIQYYLPRKDRVSLTTGGEILVTEGAPSLNPLPPPELPGSMTIGIATVAPYPSLTPTEAREYDRYDYAVLTSVLQTKRYTMADINKINVRIDRLEYYTSLSLLEQATNSLLVRSGTTGQNRFKNGILVDPFKNHSIGNTKDPSYMIAIDEVKAEARPYFRQQTIGMRFDAAASSAVKKGDVVMLPHTSNNLIQEYKHASSKRNCNELNVSKDRGTVVLDPPGILDADITQAPAINSSLDLSSNWVNLANSLNSRFGTSYGNWTNKGSATVLGTQASDKVTGTTQYTNGLLEDIETITVRNLAQEITRINRDFAASSPSETNLDFGNFVTNISVQQFVPPRQIFFTAKGMKATTEMFVFLEGVILNQNVLPLAPFTGNPNTLVLIGGNYFTSSDPATRKIIYISRDGKYFQYAGPGDWGKRLFSDPTGNVYGILRVPPATFKQGELLFRMTDVADLSVGENIIKTQCSTKLFCSALAVEKSESKLQIRDSSINIVEETETRTIYKTDSSTNTWKYYDVTAAEPGCPAENDPPDWTGITIGYGPRTPTRI
jgi:hypothetical protein